MMTYHPSQDHVVCTLSIFLPNFQKLRFLQKLLISRLGCWMSWAAKWTVCGNSNTFALTKLNQFTLDEVWMQFNLKEKKKNINYQINIFTAWLVFFAHFSQGHPQQFFYPLYLVICW